MTERLYSVYVHITPKDKRYIGITSLPVNDRWQNGLGYRKNTYFFRAIRKYGWQNIQHKVLLDDLNEDEATAVEKWLINQYRTNESQYGFNLTSGGERGKEYNDDIKRKMSENRKGIYNGDKHYCYGKHPSEWAGKDGFQKTVEMARERWSGPNNPQKINPRFGKDNHNFGKVYTKEEVWKKRESKKHLFKLNEEIITEIFKMYFEEYCTYEVIAKKYNLSFSTVGEIIRREIYCHVDCPYNYEDRHKKAKQDRITKISRPVAKIDIKGNIVIKANSVKELSEIVDWSVAGITNHLKNRVKNPVFIYL